MTLFDEYISLIDLIAYAASAFVLCSATTNNVLSFRLLSLGSNVCFVSYGYLEGITPIFLLHAFLAPMNVMQVWRAWSSLRTTRADIKPPTFQHLTASDPSRRLAFLKPPSAAAPRSRPTMSSLPGWPRH